MEETKEDSFKENLDLPRRPVTTVPADPSAPIVSTRCTTEQRGEIPESESADAQAPKEGLLQKITDPSAPSVSTQYTSEQRGEIPESLSPDSLTPKECLLQKMKDHPKTPASRRDDATIEGSFNEASTSTNLKNIVTTTPPTARFGTSGVSGGWHFHGVPISSVSSVSPLAYNFRSARDKIQQNVKLSEINLYTQEVKSKESEELELNISNENSPKKIEEKNDDKNLDSESEVISGLMGEILDKVVDIVKSPQSVASNLVNKPLQQILTEKDEVSQSDSPPEQ